MQTVTGMSMRTAALAMSGGVPSPSANSQAKPTIHAPAAISDMAERPSFREDGGH